MSDVCSSKLETRYVPPAGYSRLSAMIASRPGWNISRQRAWGVPIAIFVDLRTREPLRDEAVLKRIADTFEVEGSDAWYARDPQDFLGSDYRAEDFEQIFDIVDVWFESGSTRSEEHTSELQSLMRISYAVFCLKKKKHKQNSTIEQTTKEQENHTKYVEQQT